MVPIKLYLSGERKTATLEVENNGSKAVAIQLSAKVWDQDANGQDYYTNTRSIVFFPKIVRIEAQARQIIRVGYRPPQKAVVANNELTFRLFLRELPEQIPGSSMVSTALNIGIPIFVAATSQSVARATLHNPRVNNGAILQLDVHNPSKQHIVVNSISALAKNLRGEVLFNREVRGWYVLPGITRPFQLELPTADCADTAELNIAVRIGEQTLTRVLTNDPLWCSPAPMATGG